jgi:hypothetical protein
MGSKKKYEFQKKGTHTFFGPNIVPKKVWVPKKKELILLGTFFLFELKISSNKKESGKTNFAGTFVFV